MTTLRLRLDYGSIRFSTTKSTDSTFNLHRETNGKRLKRLTWSYHICFVFAYILRGLTYGKYF